MVPPASTRSAGLRDLLTLAWPVVLARSTQAVVGFCDAAMISSWGEDALAATTTGNLDTFAITIFPMGVVFIVQSFASQLKGANDLVAARRYAWYGMILAAVAMAIAALCAPSIGDALALFSFKGSVHEQMTHYMAMRFMAVGAFVGTEVLGNWYAGMGNTRMQMRAGVITMVLNVGLNWLLIYGNLGFPTLGVGGAAIGSVIAAWAGFAYLALAFRRGWGCELRHTGPLGLRLSELRRMVRFGLPNGLNWFLEFAAWVFFVNVIVADLGTVVHAAFMVVIQINSVSFMPAFGLASAGAIIVGQAIGRRDLAAVPLTVKRTAVVGTIYQTSVGLIYLIIPGALLRIFAPPTTSAAAVVEVGTLLLIISAAWQIFDAAEMTLSEALRAAGDTAWCMWARIIIAWAVFVPLSITWIRMGDGGAVAAILCIVFYIAALAIVFFWRFRTGAWKKIDLTGKGSPEEALLL